MTEIGPNNIFEFIKESLLAIKDFDIEITPETYLNAVELDSLDYVFVQVEVQKIFGVEINYDDFKDGQIPTFGAFADYIDNLRQKAKDADHEAASGGR